MPTEVGGLKAMGTPTTDFSMYASSDGETVTIAMVIPGMTVDTFTQGMKDPTRIGAWTCGESDDLDGMACGAVSPYGGTLGIAGIDDATKLAAWGTEFLTKWK